MIPLTQPTDHEKAAVWQAYRTGTPTRVPMMLVGNARLVLLDRQWNPEGYTFEQAATDPAIHVEIALRFALYQRTVLGRYTDSPTALPEVWTIGLSVYNTYEAASFGAAIDYALDMPDTLPPFTEEASKHEVFAVDIEHPLDAPFISGCLAFWKRMAAICADRSFEGRPVRLAPWAPCGTDGPLTVACNLRGAGNFMMDLVADPDYADRLMARIVQAALNRRRAFDRYWGEGIAGASNDNGLADDSCVLVSNDMYARCIMPHHRTFYEALPGRPRSLHMCGDATRLFPLIRERLDVTTFDTGFPVDFGWIRQQLGNDVTIHGGPEVSLLIGGTPDRVYARTRDILGSGIKRGGRFILREGNNLPPGVPEANLEAMYAACLEHGRYDP